MAARKAVKSLEYQFHSCCKTSLITVQEQLFTKNKHNTTTNITVLAADECLSSSHFSRVMSSPQQWCQCLFAAVFEAIKWLGMVKGTTSRVTSLLPPLMDMVLDDLRAVFFVFSGLLSPRSNFHLLPQAHIRFCETAWMNYVMISYHLFFFNLSLGM